MRSQAMVHYVAALPCLLMASSLMAAPALEWSRDVHFKAQHDPNLIELKEGEILRVRYDDTSWQRASVWASGQKLKLGWHTKLGAVLQDPAGGNPLPIAMLVQGDHPITQALQACEQKNDATLAMQACLSDAKSRWDRQLNINYQALLRMLSPEQQRTIKAAQRSWLIWRDAQFSAIAAAYSQEGTLWGLVAGEQQVTLVREQADRLGQQLADR